jgi:ankyrin repeat protein
MQKLNSSYFTFITILLLFSSAKIYAQTPLEKALSNRDTLTALSLINAGEDPNQINGQSSLLSSYCRYSVADSMAFFLLRHGAKPDTLRSPAGRTALHIAAAYYACEELCGALLNAGADINARTNDGATPLMLAALSAKLRLVKFLLDNGANANLKDNKGKTAYDYALRADGMDDLPEFKKNLEASCGFNKQGTIAYLKDKVQ